MTEVVNHCTSCGKPIKPEERFCKECAAKKPEPCPVCGKVICVCEIGPGD